MTMEAAEKYNAPGTFTAFIGYEWTSNTGGNNLHRVVIFRDDKDKASMMLPYTTLKPEGSDNPRDLWNWMGEYENKSGGNVLAIAHNGNLSNGIMFPVVDSFTGNKLDKSYAETRILERSIYSFFCRLVNSRYTALTSSSYLDIPRCRYQEPNPTPKKINPRIHTPELL